MKLKISIKGLKILEVCLDIINNNSLNVFVFVMVKSPWQRIKTSLELNGTGGFGHFFLLILFFFSDSGGFTRPPLSGQTTKKNFSLCFPREAQNFTQIFRTRILKWVKL